MMMEKPRKCFILLAALAIMLVVVIFHLDKITLQICPEARGAVNSRQKIVKTQRGRGSGCLEDSLQLGTEASQKKLVKVVRSLRRAFRYARSSKTQNEIMDSMGILEGLLNRASIQKAQQNDNEVETTGNNGEVCRDSWGGFHVGFPFYHQGIQTEQCPGPKPLSSLLSIFLNFVTEISLDNLQTIVEDILASKYKNIEFVIATQTGLSKEKEKLLRKLKNAKRLTFNASEKLPQVLSKMAKSTDKKYVLVARDLERFNDFAKPERLVRMLSYKKADAASGATRNVTGHWRYGCYQSKLIAYQYRLVEGYDMSYNSCMYCDYASGPFSIYRELLITLTENRERRVFESNEAFYLNLFHQMKIKGKIVLSCVDVMFHSKKVPFVGLTRDALLPFIRNFRINQVETPSERKIAFSCSEAETMCGDGMRKGTVLPLCCYRQLTECLGFMARVFDRNNIYYELDSGSTLGSVKVDETLPWERDHDLNLYMNNISAVMKLNPLFEQQGYKLKQTQEVGLAECCPDYKNTGNKCWFRCGYVALKCPNWRIELWGRQALSSDMWRKYGVSAMTRSRVGKDFVQTHANPGAYSAGKHGMNALKHAEHWLASGMGTGRAKYKAGEWSNCDLADKNFHGCLNRYMPDGNLQFKEVWI